MIARGRLAPRPARASGVPKIIVIRLLNVLSELEGGPAPGAAVARLCSASGTAENVWETVETVFCALPAEVVSAWLTAAIWLDTPPGSVLCCGEVNGVSVVAAADQPA